MSAAALVYTEESLPQASWSSDSYNLSTLIFICVPNRVYFSHHVSERRRGTDEGPDSQKSEGRRKERRGYTAVQPTERLT